MDEATTPELHHEYLPPEIIIDENHPAGDEYMRNIESIKQRIVSACAVMTSTHIESIKLQHIGKSTADIADRLDINTNTVRRIAKTPKGLRLSALLKHLSLAIDGPREAHRKHVLWRIAIKSEEKDPRVAIAAIAEINKMTHQKEALEAGQLGGQKLEIIINNEQFPRGVLDK